MQEIYDCWDVGNCGYEICENIYNCTNIETNFTVLCSADTCSGNHSVGLLAPVDRESCTLESVCKPSEGKTWQVMGRPLTATLQTSLNILNDSLDNETMDKVHMILQEETLEFILKPIYMKPLIPYIRAECNWCFSSNISVTQLLLDKLSYGLLVQVPSLLDDVAAFTDELNATYLYNGDFLFNRTDRLVIL